MLQQDYPAFAAAALLPVQSLPLHAAMVAALDDRGRDLDHTGCGNTFACARPAASRLILETLRHWVRTFHVDGFRFDLEDDSWLLIRFSGTEPVMRIYAESNSPEQVKNLLAAGKELVSV